MSILVILMPLAILLGLGFVVAFIVAVRSGQYDDLDTPAHRILIDDVAADDQIPKNKTESLSNKSTKQVAAERI